MILNKVFNENFDNIYNKIYSGLFTIESLTINKYKYANTDLNDLRTYPHSQLSSNLKDLDNKNHRTYSDENILKKKISKMA